MPPTKTKSSRLYLGNSHQMPNYSSPSNKSITAPYPDTDLSCVSLGELIRLINAFKVILIQSPPLKAVNLRVMLANKCYLEGNNHCLRQK